MHGNIWQILTFIKTLWQILTKLSYCRKKGTIDSSTPEIINKIKYSYLLILWICILNQIHSTKTICVNDKIDLNIYLAFHNLLIIVIAYIYNSKCIQKKQQQQKQQQLDLRLFMSTSRYDSHSQSLN